MRAPVVKLIAYTPNPIEVVFATEKFAKTNTDNPALINPQFIAMIRNDYQHFGEPGSEMFSTYMSQWQKVCTHVSAAGYKTVAEYVKDVEDWALKVINMQVPISEMIQFSFQIENVTIAWREQLVRTKVGASYWIQSGRITPKEKFWDNGEFHIPETVKANDAAGVLWREHLIATQRVISDLTRLGIPIQDVRELLGSGNLHRLTFSVQLRALLGMLKHRTCWIAQKDLWSPIVKGICNELYKIDPVFSALSKPPCLTHDNKFTKCAYTPMVLERIQGKDPLKVCPMFHAHMSKDDPNFVTRDALKGLGRWPEQSEIDTSHDLWKYKPDVVRSL